jgi:hypothetical protein
MISTLCKNLERFKDLERFVKHMLKPTGVNPKIKSFIFNILSASRQIWSGSIMSKEEDNKSSKRDTKQSNQIYNGYPI